MYERLDLITVNSVKMTASGFAEFSRMKGTEKSVFPFLFSKNTKCQILNVELGAISKQIIKLGRKRESNPGDESFFL